MAMKKGRVYLVGAGPGDPGLITVKGLNYLRKAEVIIYDRLVEEGLLDQANARAEKIYAGKAADHHIWEQEEINQLLLKKAIEGKRVVRLKGGDPFVFGRGGEEAEFLARHHIPFEVVPGVSSAHAVPAYAGIPVTHRNLASSFAVVTGHKAIKSRTPSIDWKKLSQGVDTLLIMMGLTNLPNIIAQLKKDRPSSTPVAVITHGTTGHQRCVTGMLKNILAKVRAEKLEPPAIIIVGDVVRLREDLRWFEKE